MDGPFRPVHVKGFAAFVAYHVEAQAIVPGWGNLSFRATLALGFLLLGLPWVQPKDKSVSQQNGRSAAIEGNDAALLAAARTGDVSRVTRLLTAGVTLTGTDEEDRDALMLAIINNHEDAVRLLLAAGANVNAQAPDNWTPLMFALHMGSPTILRDVLAAGANLNVRYGAGQTPLIAAAVGSSSTNKVEILLTLGASPLEEDYNGWTALMAAAEGNSGTETLRVLIAAGCDVNHRSHDGKIALICARLELVSNQTL
jgi:ankyrin repeat protein